MALTKNSTILISDISSALSGKQDKLAYVPVKSVNGTSADANGAVTISTGGGTAIAVSNVAAWGGYTSSADNSGGVGTFSQGDYADNGVYYYKWTAPAGGTWLVFKIPGSTGATVQKISGGSSVRYVRGLAIRIA